MIDIQLIRDDVAAITARLARRGHAPDFSVVQDLDRRRREVITRAEERRHELKSTSKLIGARKQAGQDAEDVMSSMRTLKEGIDADEAELAQIEEQLRMQLLNIPNVPDDNIPTGTSDRDNKVLRTWGTPRVFNFEPKAHDDLGKALGIMSAELGVSLAKSRFTLLRGAAARLERALINFMLDHNGKRGYEEVLPPFLANAKTMTGTGQLPKFAADLFKLENEDLYLIPTAEVPLTNMVADSVLKEIEPGRALNLTAYTPCFRSEAGSYGKDTKGYIRQHQFNKVEIVKICHPDDSVAEHEKLVADSESILQALELPYKVVDLCTGDLGFSSRRTYDIEVWLPSQKTYREISSCSNFGDFQARRAGIRFKDAATKKNMVAHTLNGSALAVGRTLVAIFENGQNADGSIDIPAVLHPYMGGLKKIT